MKEIIKVLIVDDSAVIRQSLSAILNEDPFITVIATASDPVFAMQKLEKQMPDVITLDIEMPRIDGLTFLRKIMSENPVPVIIISGLTENGADSALKALELGAVEIINKPRLNTKQFIEESKIKLCDAVKAASCARLKKIKVFSPSNYKIEPKNSVDAIIPKLTSNKQFTTSETVVAVGASTGGTDALQIFLQAMPHDAPGIVIVQHMPEHFTRSFANRLNEICTISVKEAVDGDPVLRGQALIAPGNYHMLLKRSGTKYYVEIREGTLVNRHRPSVDVLFRSTARYAGKNAIGIIMTGMGGDGATGLLEMKEAGAYTIAQNEQTCVVYGMPQEAIKLGAVNKILPLDQIAREMISEVRKKHANDS